MRIGVGMLKRTDQKAYGSFRLRPVADHGKWSVKRKVDSIEMSDGSSGFGYEYRKTQVSNHTFLVFLLVTRTTRQVAPYGKDPKQTNAKRPPRERVSSNGDSGKCAGFWADDADLSGDHKVVWKPAGCGGTQS